ERGRVTMNLKSRLDRLEAAMPIRADVSDKQFSEQVAELFQQACQPDASPDLRRRGLDIVAIYTRVLPRMRQAGEPEETCIAFERLLDRIRGMLEQPQAASVPVVAMAATGEGLG